ncbi:MAG: LemA family protein [Candidatus Niyogibacteria bacterium]|nr:LemA family protein [Candidatus Niyogibacteria bacterium]
MNSITWIIIGIIAAILGWLILTYNRLVTLRMRAREALSDIDVQLKRRFDLIPNLMEAVKGYMQHERQVLENVTEARARVASTKGGPVEREHQENILTETLKTLFAVAENYPDLKANVNFLELQRELSDTENKIQASRRFYNTTIRDLNTKIQTFPTNLIAGWFRFFPEKFFEVENEEERKTPKVQF